MSTDCKETFEKPRSVADPRLRIELNESGNLAWKYQDMPLVTAREIVQRIALHLRMGEMYQKDTMLRLVTNEFGLMIQLEMYPWESDKFICVAFNFAGSNIRAAISGMDAFQAAVVCDSAASYFDKEIIGEYSTNGT